MGLPLAIVGLVFLVFLGWRLLPKHRKGSHNELALAIEDYITEIQLSNQTKQPLASVGELEERLPEEAQLLGIVRDKKRRFSLRKTDRLLAGDILVLEGSPDGLQEVMRLMQATLVGSSPDAFEKLKADDMTLMEGVISERSRLENSSSESLRLRTRFQLVVLAISRGGKTIRTRIGKTKLQAGDVLLIQGPSDTLKQNAAQLGLLPLQGRDLSPLSKPKTFLPIAFFIVAIILTSLGLAPVQITFTGAIVLMVVFRTIPARLLYEGVDWPIVLLLGAMIPIGVALQTSGGSALISQTLFQLIAHLPPWGLIGLIILVTMTLSDFMNNAATAIIMAPIAESIAANLGANPDAFLMAVAIGASCAFITPIGHQNNLLVMGPGGYKFSDYLRAGLPLEFIVLILGTPLLLWAWPL